MMKRRGFTLIELSVAVALMVMAITITLFATIGTNSLIEKTETRGQIVQGARETIDNLRRATVGLSTREVKVITDIVYNPETDDTPRSFTAEENTAGFAVEIKRFGTAQRDNTCQLLGQVQVKKETSGEKFFLKDSGGQIGLLVFRMNAAGMCEYSSPLYKGTLTESGLLVKDFSLLLVPQEYSCGSVRCKIGQLRFKLNIEANGLGNQRQPAIDTAGSVALLVERQVAQVELRGIAFDPSASLTLQPGATQNFVVRAGYSDSTFPDVTGSANVEWRGGNYDLNTRTYTAGNVAGQYELIATYQGHVTTTLVTIGSTGGGGGPVLQSITLSPPSACIRSGGSLQFTVTGNYSDSTTDTLTNSSSYTLSPVFGTISFGTYQAPTVSVETIVNLTARFGEFVSNTSIITVKPSCKLITPEPI